MSRANVSDSASSFASPRRASLRALLRRWQDGFAVSGLAYLLREQAWMSASWKAQARPRRRRPLRALAAG